MLLIDWYPLPDGSFWERWRPGWGESKKIFPALACWSCRDGRLQPMILSGWPNDPLQCAPVQRQWTRWWWMRGGCTPWWLWRPSLVNHSHLNTFHSFQKCSVISKGKWLTRPVENWTGPQLSVAGLIYSAVAGRTFSAGSSWWWFRWCSPPTTRHVMIHTTHNTIRIMILGWYDFSQNYFADKLPFLCYYFSWTNPVLSCILHVSQYMLLLNRFKLQFKSILSII